MNQKLRDLRQNKIFTNKIFSMIFSVSMSLDSDTNDNPITGGRRQFDLVVDNVCIFKTKNSLDFAYSRKLPFLFYK